MITTFNPPNGSTQKYRRKYRGEYRAAIHLGILSLSRLIAWNTKKPSLGLLNEAQVIVLSGYIAMWQNALHEQIAY